MQPSSLSFNSILDRVYNNPKLSSMADLSLNIVCKYEDKYYGNFPQTCDVRHNTRLFFNASREFCNSWLKVEECFVVPRLNKFQESKNRIKKHRLVEGFISFLLQLLHPESDELYWVIYREFKDQIKNLERELRILLTILGDTLFLLCDDENEEFQKLLAEFEAVANEAASLVHSLVFPSDRGLVYALIFPLDPAYIKLVEDFDVVLNRIDFLKTSIMKFLNLVRCINTSSAYVTPKISVVASLLAVDSLIYDLKDLMNREDNSIADVKDEIERLYHGLTLVQSSIKHIGWQQPSEIGELKEPLLRIGDMARGAEYLTVSLLAGDAPLCYVITRLTDINDKIDRIATELIEITKKYTCGGLKVAEHFSAQLPLEAKENAEVDDVTVGFEDKVRYILDKLVGGTKHLQAISIFGMPGLGKTTLAKKLYNHPTLNYHFDKLSWCVVSQTYLRRSLLTNILIHIGSELGKDRILKMDEEQLVEGMDEEELVEGIHKTLKGRRYLIVMDDIWDSKVWDDLRRCFPDDGNGSRVMFTTRNKDVAPPNSIFYALPSLSNEQSWELLEKKVFNDVPCPPELLRIGKKIAANCRGLPLAVVAVAGILSTINRERSRWEEVQENLASYIFEGGDSSSVMQILELSYKHLADHLKPCFLYFAAFREDKEIPVRKLMWLWNSEGFVRKEVGKSAENVAEEYLTELIDKSLVMVARRRSDGGVKACVIHDLLRELCFKICEEENFLKFEECNFGFMSLEPEGWALHGGSATWSYCQHIRSFHGCWLTSRLYVRDMRLLRILVPHCTLKCLIGIEYLVNLRYLVINSDDHLFASIGRLVNLEYLRVMSGRILYLPPEIVKMSKLRYIEAGSGVKYDRDCSNSSETSNLEFLSSFVIGELRDQAMLKCSPHLRKLKCRSDPSSSSFDLRFLTQLESLNLALLTNIWYWKGEIKFPSNIRKLALSGIKLCWEQMSRIGGLEKLEVLKLQSVSFEGETWDTRDGEFQNLRFLRIERTLLNQWNVGSSQHFPRLRRLVLRYCFALEEIPVEMSEIATLQMIELGGYCDKSLCESAQRIQQEQWDDMGNEEFKVIITAHD